MTALTATPLLTDVAAVDAMPSPASDATPVEGRHKIVAASLGSLLTALTMTPFDVVKTRLQTQQPPAPLFETAQHLPPPRHFSPASNPAQPMASTSRVKLDSPPRHMAASTSATCCQPTTFFGCRFDTARNMSAVAVEALPRGMMTSFAATSTAGQGMTLLDAEAACAYPDAKAATDGLTRDSKRLNGMADAVVKIVRHEGPAALWRGVGPALAMSVPTSAAYMVGYDALRARLLASADPSDHVYTAAATLFAGGLARAIVVTVVSPLELLRTRLQSAHHSFPDVFRSYRGLVREQGPAALWRGLPPTLWRDVPFSAIYWASYEFVRRGLTGGRGMGEMAQGESRSKAFSVAFIGGAVSGSVAAACTNPFDVIKTRRQASSDAEHAKTLDLLKTLARREGVRGMLSGLTPRIAKVAPACGIMISVYEAAAHYGRQPH